MQMSDDKLCTEVTKKTNKQSLVSQTIPKQGIIL